MSVNFSTIRPLDPSTISRKPAFSTEPSNPSASAPIGAEPNKKKSHWFLKTLAATAVAVAAVVLLRNKVDAFKTFDKAADIAADAKFMDKAAHYGKKAIAVVSDFITEKSMDAYKAVKGLFKKGTSAGTPPAPPAP